MPICKEPLKHVPSGLDSYTRRLICIIYMCSMSMCYVYLLGSVCICVCDIYIYVCIYIIYIYIYIYIYIANICIVSGLKYTFRYI